MRFNLRETCPRNRDGHHDLEEILKNNDVDTEAWEASKQRPLPADPGAEVASLEQRDQLERAREDQIGRPHRRVAPRAEHPPARPQQENLDHKVKAATLAARLAGMGVTGARHGEDGARFSVTINLGGDNQVEFRRMLPRR
jgi:hypothetical protein